MTDINSLSQGKLLNNPDLKTALDFLKTEIMLQTNCHGIATIQSFDPSTQIVTASMNYKKTFYDGKTGLPVYKNYPLLVDVPVVVLSGGTGALTMPIEAGDTCLILFNDRDIDNWFTTGQIQPVATARLHSFSDGIALVGLRSLKNPIQDYDPSRAVLRKGNAMVGVGNELVKISNEMTSLKNLINGLIDILATLTSAMSAATPANVSATVGAPSASATTSLNAYKTTVGGLLE